jgi:hypothetical protein
VVVVVVVVVVAEMVDGAAEEKNPLFEVSLRRASNTTYFERRICERQDWILEATALSKIAAKS